MPTLVRICFSMNVAYFSCLLQRPIGPGLLHCAAVTRDGRSEALRVYVSEAPEEVQEVSRTAGLQHQAHWQGLDATVQHSHHVLMSAHGGVEMGPLHKLLSFGLVGGIYAGVK